MLCTKRRSFDIDLRTVYTIIVKCVSLARAQYKGSHNDCKCQERKKELVDLEAQGIDLVATGVDSSADVPSTAIYAQRLQQSYLHQHTVHSCCSRGHPFAIVFEHAQ